MQTGWKKISGSWYFLGSNGAMVTGSVMIGGNCEWWLRSMGAGQTWVSSVESGGFVTEGGNWIMNSGVGVRPVICIKK